MVLPSLLALLLLQLPGGHQQHLMVGNASITVELGLPKARDLTASEALHGHQVEFLRSTKLIGQVERLNVLGEARPGTLQDA